MAKKHPGMEIRMARTAILMQAKDLARAIGRSKAYMSRFERGYITVPDTELAALRAAIVAYKTAKGIA